MPFREGESYDSPFFCASFRVVVAEEICGNGALKPSTCIQAQLRKLVKSAFVDYLDFRITKLDRALRFKLLEHLVDGLPRQCEHHREIFLRHVDDTSHG